MKKLIYIAVFTVSGLGFVSCTADSASIDEKQQVNATDIAGPGDGLIPVKPPKP
jgi:hypothetical protein